MQLIESLEPRIQYSGAHQLDGRMAFSGSIASVNGTMSIPLKLVDPGWIYAREDAYANWSDHLSLRLLDASGHVVKNGLSGAPNVLQETRAKIPAGQYELEVRRIAAAPVNNGVRHGEFVVSVAPDYAGSDVGTLRNGGSVVGTKQFHDFFGVIDSAGVNTADLYRLSMPRNGTIEIDVNNLPTGSAITVGRDQNGDGRYAPGEPGYVWRRVAENNGSIVESGPVPAGVFYVLLETPNVPAGAGFNSSTMTVRWIGPITRTLTASRQAPPIANESQHSMADLFDTPVSGEDSSGVFSTKMIGDL